MGSVVFLLCCNVSSASCKSLTSCLTLACMLQVKWESFARAFLLMQVCKFAEANNRPAKYALKKHLMPNSEVNSNLVVHLGSTHDSTVSLQTTRPS